MKIFTSVVAVALSLLAPSLADDFVCPFAGDYNPSSITISPNGARLVGSCQPEDEPCAAGTCQNKLATVSTAVPPPFLGLGTEKACLVQIFDCGDNTPSTVQFFAFGCEVVETPGQSVSTPTFFPNPEPRSNPLTLFRTR